MVEEKRMIGMEKMVAQSRMVGEMRGSISIYHILTDISVYKMVDGITNDGAVVKNKSVSMHAMLHVHPLFCFWIVGYSEC